MIVITQKPHKAKELIGLNECASCGADRDQLRQAMTSPEVQNRGLAWSITRNCPNCRKASLDDILTDEQVRLGFSLNEPDDHVVLLKLYGIILGTFSQMAVPEGIKNAVEHFEQVIRIYRNSPAFEQDAMDFLREQGWRDQDGN